MPTSDKYSVSAFDAGGFDYPSTYGSLSEGFGRIVNNITGASAKNQFEAEQALLARQFNSAEAARDRDFQLYMSNTAYSRAAQDMKNAGINPAALGGNAVAAPASTPQGSRAASAPAASGSFGGSGILDIARSAISMALFKKFSHSAKAAATAPAAVSNVTKEAKEAITAEKVAKAAGAKKVEFNSFRHDPQFNTDSALPPSAHYSAKYTHNWKGRKWKIRSEDDWPF